MFFHVSGLQNNKFFTDSLVSFNTSKNYNGFSKSKGDMERPQNKEFFRKFKSKHFQSDPLSSSIRLSVHMSFR